MPHLQDECNAINLNCPIDQDCYVTCSGTYSCNNAEFWFTANQINKVLCTGEHSCDTTAFQCAKSGVEICTTFLICDGPDSCTGVWLPECPSPGCTVVCKGEGSCANLDCTGAGCPPKGV